MVDKNTSSLSLQKKILFSIIPLLALILVGEIAVRAVYFQLKDDYTFALTKAYDLAAHKVKLMRAGSIVAERRQTYEGVWEALFSEPGRELLLEFQAEYERHFAELVVAARDAGTKLIVLFLPSAMPNRDITDSEMQCRDFYRSLAVKYDVEYLDLTEQLRSQTWEDVTLLPQNGHLSRYGNRIVASELNQFLDQFKNHRSPRKMSDQVAVFGDLNPSQNGIWDIDPHMPYRVITNSQGLRNLNDLEAKEKQRILILGDSFTFGPFLPNHDTYPALLEQVAEDLEVINAGVAGYTITDEVPLFIERAQFSAPDITVLQVLDNDIYGLFYFKKNDFDRSRKVYRPSPLEKSFLEEVLNSRS